MSGRRTADVTDTRVIHDTFCRLYDSIERWQRLYRTLQETSFESGLTPEQRCQSATTLWLKLAELDDTMLLQENQEDLDKAKQTFFSNLEATDDVATRLKRHWEQVETKIPALLTYMNSREEQAEGSPS